MTVVMMLLMSRYHEFFNSRQAHAINAMRRPWLEEVGIAFWALRGSPPGDLQASFAKCNFESAYHGRRSAVSCWAMLGITICPMDAHRTRVDRCAKDVTDESGWGEVRLNINFELGLSEIEDSLVGFNTFDITRAI